jgi:4-amino-4-deoxy-L-arabinose transferase-like glycosyltransferase
MVAALCTIYLLVGLIGHDPWKADDATHFGIAYSMLESGQWWLPQLAGEALPGTPPLYYWIAALCAKAFGWFLPLHDATRIATGLFGALMIAGVAACARFLNDPETGLLAALIAVGSVGLPVHLHDTQPAIALMAAIGFAMLGIARLPDKPVAGGLIAGASLGTAALAEGWNAVALVAPLVLAAPVLGRPWRSPSAIAGVLLAIGAGAAIASIWPASLYWKAPEMFAQWSAGMREEVASFDLSGARITGYLSLLSWHAWPALPLALWTVWSRRRVLAQPATFLPLVATALLLLSLSGLSAARSLYALPLLVPMAILAAPAAASLRRGAANAFDWFAMMTFTVFAVLAWLGWSAMAFGVPSRLARQLLKMEPGFVLHQPWWPLAAAAAMSLGWLVLIIASPRHPVRGTVMWSAGMVLTWFLLMTLWLPWIDYQKSYRTVAVSLSSALPAKHGCIAGRELSRAQRASFHYFAGITTVPHSSPAARKCRLTLLQATSKQENPSPGPGWRKIWEGRRPGDRNEIFQLYTLR